MECDSGQKLRLSVIDEHGGRAVDADVGGTLLQTLQAGGIAIGAVCGGGMICGTCHVLLARGDPAERDRRSDGETLILGELRYFEPDRSRLACQVRVSFDLVGCDIIIAPDE